jgi:hypothetical protein
MKERSGEGVEDMGYGGSFAPPIPHGYPPLPMPIDLEGKFSRSQGEG